MSRSLGSALPETLLARLVAPAAAARLDDVAVLVTVDPYGWPHPALLSYAEILALDHGRLRLLLHTGSRASVNLRDAGRATLLFADAELCLYVKAETFPLGPAPDDRSLARFELVVRDVLEDRAEGEETGAQLTSGLTVAWPGDAASAAARYARMRRILSA